MGSLVPVFIALASVLYWALVFLGYVVGSLAVTSAVSTIYGCVFESACFSFATVASLVEVASCASWFCL